MKQRFKAPTANIGLAGIPTILLETTLAFNKKGINQSQLFKKVNSI